MQIQAQKKIKHLDGTLIAKLTKKSYLTTVVALQSVDPEGTDKDNDCQQANQAAQPPFQYLNYFHTASKFRPL